MVYWFAKAAGTHHRKLGLKRQNCVLSGFRRPEVRDQGVGRAMFPLKVLERNLPCFFLASGGSQASLVCLALSLPPSRFCLRPHTAPGPRWSSVCPRLPL